MLGLGLKISNITAVALSAIKNIWSNTSDLWSNNNKTWS